MINVLVFAVIVKLCLEAKTEGTVFSVGSILLLYSVWCSRALRASFVITVVCKSPNGRKVAVNISWDVCLCSSGILCAWGRAECHNWKEHVAIHDLVSWSEVTIRRKTKDELYKKFCTALWNFCKEVLQRALWNNSSSYRGMPQIDLSLFCKRFPHPMKSCLDLSSLSLLKCFYASFPAKSNLRELLVFWWWGKGKQRLKPKLPSAVLVCVGILQSLSFIYFR